MYYKGCFADASYLQYQFVYIYSKCHESQRVDGLDNKLQIMEGEMIYSTVLFYVMQHESKIRCQQGVSSHKKDSHCCNPPPSFHQNSSLGLLVRHWGFNPSHRLRAVVMGFPHCPVFGLPKCHLHLDTCLIRLSLSNSRGLSQNPGNPSEHLPYQL